MLEFTKTLGPDLHKSLISTVLKYINFQFLLNCINQSYAIHVKMLKEFQDLSQYINRQMQLIKLNS